MEQLWADQFVVVVAEIVMQNIEERALTNEPYHCGYVTYLFLFIAFVALTCSSARDYLPIRGQDSE